MKILESLCVQSPAAVERVALELEVLCRPEGRTNEHLASLLPHLNPFLRYLNANQLSAISKLCLQATTSNSEQVRISAFRNIQLFHDSLGKQEDFQRDVNASLLLALKTESSEDAL